MRPGSSSKGFTLIEILLVVSIIAILSSAAAINASSRVKLARDVAVRQNLAVLRDAVGRYYMSTGRFPERLGDLRGGQVKNALLSWEGGNASGTIGYDRSSGDVFLAGKTGARPVEKDYRGVNYSEY